MARPSKAAPWLTPEALDIVAGWARQGLSDEQIAGNMGIDARTLYRWKKKFSQFCRCLEESKAKADIQVENALFKRAMGYDYEEITKTADEAGNLVETRRVLKHVPGDVTAQKYWLSVRDTKWREGARDEAKNEILSSLVDLLKTEQQS